MHNTKVLNISYTPGVVAHEFHRNLKKQGIDSSMLCLYSDDVNNVLLKRDYELKDLYIIKSKLYYSCQRIKNKFFKKKNNESKFEYHFSNGEEDSIKFYTKNVVKHVKKINPDVIVIHVLDGFLNTKDINFLFSKVNIPIYWYMIDMSPLTGGCSFPWDCKEYIKGCGKCPAISSKNRNDITKIISEKRQRNLENVDITPLVGSTYQLNIARSNFIFQNKESHLLLIANDDNTFYPIDSKRIQELRKQYKVSTQKTILFFGVNNMKNIRKGWKTLKEALINISKYRNSKDIFLMMVGRVKDEDVINHLIDKYNYDGILLDFVPYEKLVELYNIADFYICPSLEDAGPQMINQSISCGTPVLSFDIGVSRDLVFEGKTGFKTNNISVKGLEKVITSSLDLSTNDRILLRKNCIELSESNLSSKRQVESFLKIVKSKQEKICLKKNVTAEK